MEVKPSAPMLSQDSSFVNSTSILWGLLHVRLCTQNTCQDKRGRSPFLLAPLPLEGADKISGGDVLYRVELRGCGSEFSLFHRVVGPLQTQCRVA